MDSAANPDGTPLPASSTPPPTSTQRTAVRPAPLEIVFFVIGIIILAVASVLVHAHPQPYPFDLQTTQTLQTLQTPAFVTPTIDFFSSLNDPIPSIIALAVWLVGLIVIGLVARARGRSPVKWFQSAAGLIITVGIAGGLNFIINWLVARPRPGTFGEKIRVLSHIPVNSFPSGHTEHDVSYYGFILYLSLTPPVRSWRYRWILIPFQIFAAIDILTIGYSRILEGEHWLTDVLAGYLSGALWLLMCIFLYRLITDIIAQRLQAQGVPASETISTEASAI